MACVFFLCLGSVRFWYFSCVERRTHFWLSSWFFWGFARQRASGAFRSVFKSAPERDASYFTRMSGSVAWRSAELRALALGALLALVNGGPRPEHRSEHAEWTQRVQYPAGNDAQRVQFPSLHDTQRVQIPSVDDPQVQRQSWWTFVKENKLLA